MSVRSVNFSADGLRIVSGSFDRTVRVWDSTSGALLSELIGHVKYVSSVFFSKDSKEVVSGSGDRSVKIWSAFGGPNEASDTDLDRLQNVQTNAAIAATSHTPTIREVQPNAFPVFQVEDRVEAQFENGDEFFAARVVAVAADGSYSVLYDDGDKEDNLQSHRVRPPA